MTNETIQIPVRLNLEGKEFYADRKDKALRGLQNQGYKALFMPQLIDARIYANNKARIWSTFFDSVSPIINGRYKERLDHERLIVHAPTSALNLDYLTEQIEQKKLVYGAAIIPQNEFDQLRDEQDDSNIFAVQDNELRQW